MPDRYGDDADELFMIANCGLCDDEGVRGMHRCDHVDHAGAARRGMDMIRRAMGWES